MKKKKKNNKNNGPRCKVCGTEPDSGRLLRGMCRAHYEQELKRTGPLKREHPVLCEVADCGRPFWSRFRGGQAVCNTHWTAAYRAAQKEPTSSAHTDTCDQLT